MNQDQARTNWAAWGFTWLIVVTMLVTFALSACGPTAPVASRAPACASEDGAGPDQGYPCQWDCRVQGNRLCGRRGHPVILYVDGPCPTALPDDTTCININTWSTPGAS
jgi:hypothetical protein